MTQEIGGQSEIHISKCPSSASSSGAEQRERGSRLGKEIGETPGVGCGEKYGGGGVMWCDTGKAKGTSVKTYSCGQTISGAVANADSILLGLELGNGADRAEDLLLHDLHVLGDVGEDGGLNEVALVALALATSLTSGTGALAVLNVASCQLMIVPSDCRAWSLPHNAVELQLRDLRTLESALVEGVANDVLEGALLEASQELVVDALLDVDTGAGAAALAVVEEDTEIDPGDGVVDIGVLEDDVGRLAAELESNLLQVGTSSRLEDLTANDGRTSEGDLVNVHVRGNGLTSDLAETRDDVDDTRREASLLDQAGGDQRGQGSLLGGLDNDSVTGRNGGTDLPRPHEQGEVPGNNLATDTNLHSSISNSSREPNQRRGRLTGSFLMYEKVSRLVSQTLPWILSAQPP